MNKQNPKHYVLLWCSALFLFLPLLSAGQALGWDVTFTRDKNGARTSSSFNLTVVLERQGNNIGGSCKILWSGTSCTITDIPSTTNALVTVWHSTGTSGGQRNAIGKIQFWVSVFENSEIHIPTGVVSFKADKTWNELVGLKCCDLAILPQGNIEIGETFSDRPNSGTAYFGQTFSNCGAKDLGSDQAATCTVDFLAGCYSPVFARDGATASNKAKIWVNRTELGGADHVMCVNDGQTVDYLIKVQ